MRRIIILAVATLGGLLAALLAAYAWKKLAPEITPWGAASAVVLAGLALWSRALFIPAPVAHRSMPIHKYLMPCAYSCLGAMIGGLAGFSAGLVASSVLLAVSDFPRHAFMYHVTQGEAGDPGSMTSFVLVARLLAGALVGFVLWKSMGLGWTSAGLGGFSDALSSPGSSGMGAFAGLGALFGFLHELSEHAASAVYRMA